MNQYQYQLQEINQRSGVGYSSQKYTVPSSSEEPAELSYRTGNYFLKIGEFEKARDAFYRAAIEWNNKGRDLVSMGLYEEALAAFNKSIEIDALYKLEDFVVNPQYAVACQNMGETLHKLARYSEAIEFYGKAIVSWNNLGSYTKSIEICRNLLELDPRNADIWTNLGLAYAAVYQYENATQAIDNAIKINPENANIWTIKGDILYHFCQYNEAIKAYNRAIDIDSQNTEAWNGKGAAFFELGQCKLVECRDIQEYDSDYKDALECFDKAIQINSEYGDAWHWKGITLEFLSHGDEELISSSEDAFAKAKMLRHSDYLAPNVFGLAQHC